MAMEGLSRAASIKNRVMAVVLPVKPTLSKPKKLLDQVCDVMRPLLFTLEAISQIGAGRVAGRFLAWARRDEEAYPQRSATEK